MSPRPPPAEDEPPGAGEPAGGQPTGERTDPDAASAPAVEAQVRSMLNANEAGGAFDILKPGSRWRLNRGSRLSNSDGATTGNPPTPW